MSATPSQFGTHCDDNLAYLQGSIGGTPFMQDYPRGLGFGSHYAKPDWALTSMITESGFLTLHGAGDTSTFAPFWEVLPDGQKYPASGLLVVPIGAPKEGSVLCAGPGSQVFRASKGYDFALQSAGVLGTCPGGTPVAGELVACYSLDFAAAGCGQKISGTIEATTVAETVYNPGVGQDKGLDGTDLIAKVRTKELGGVSGDIASAVIVTSATGPFGGAVYCAGAGSTFTVQMTPQKIDVHTFTLRSLSKLGTCKAGTDHVEGCVR